MATKTSLIINAVNEGKTLQKAISDVNPSATTAELKAFAQGMLGLTDYTYTNGALVERTGIDDTSELPYSTGTFWLGDEQLELERGYEAGEFFYTFSYADFDSNPSIWHDTNNHIYKFNVMTRGIDSGAFRISEVQRGWPTLLPTSGGLYQVPGESVNEAEWWGRAMLCEQRQDGNYMTHAGIQFKIPDNGISTGTHDIGQYCVMGTSRTKLWFVYFKLTV